MDGARDRPTSMTGRAEELRALRHAAEDGSGAIVVITGEAGIGKSLLIREHLRASQLAGDVVLRGGCVELLGDPLPYAPFAEALRELYSRLERHQSERLAGHVRESLDHLVGIRPVSVGLGRPELFERVLRLLEELIPQSAGTDSHSGSLTPTDTHIATDDDRRARLVLAIEDLQWADQATLDLLIFLARNLTHRFQLVLSCRTEGLPSDDHLQAVLGALRHGRGFRRLVLGRLTRQDIAEIARLDDRTVTDEDVDRIFARSEGNPLIAEELAESTRQGVGMTQTLQELLLARTAHLDQVATQVVQVAAIVGRRVDHDTLAAASELPEPELLQGLSAAVGSGVLFMDADREEYAFRHVLTQEAVLARMLPGEKRRWHARVARAIADQPQSRSSAGRAAEAATHWYASDSHVDAYPAAVAAGRLSARVFAYSEAWRHYQQALRLAERLDTGAEDVVPRALLLAEAAEAARWAGALDEAVRLVGSAGGIEADALIRGRLGERLGRYLWESGRSNEAAIAYERADEQLAGMAASATAASVKASRANLLMITGQHSAAVQVARRAAELARDAAAELPAARADITLGMSLTFLGSPNEGVTLVRRGHRVVAQLGDLDERRRAASNLAYALLMVGDTVTACDVAVEGVALMRRYGLEARAGAALAGNAVVLLRHVGRWEEAERLSDEILAQDIPDAQARHLHLARAGLEIARGRLDVARRHLDRAYPPEVLDQTHPVLASELLGAEAELALERGDLDEAHRRLTRAAAMLSMSEHTRAMVQIVRLGLQIEADIAERNRTAKRTSPEHRIRREHLHELLDAATTSQLPEVTAHRVTAEAEYRRCLLTDDSDQWMPAVREWEKLGRPRELAYCSLRSAEAQLDSRRSAKVATEALLRGHRIATELGAEPLLRRARDLARRGRIPLETAQQPQPAGRITPDEIQRLRITPRELDVLRQLANGCSNQEIAAHLFISNRTVAVHVSNLLAKLGVSRRGQAAAAALKLGLIDN